jgi:H+/Cl- antiporter ClcA
MGKRAYLVWQRLVAAIATILGILCLFDVVMLLVEELPRRRAVRAEEYQHWFSEIIITAAITLLFGVGLLLVGLWLWRTPSSDQQNTAT